MSRVTRHYRMPVASTASVTYPRLFQNGKSVTIYFDYFVDGAAKRSGIRFNDAIATFTRREQFSSSWNVKAFDTLTEIHESAWKSQISEEIAERHHSQLDSFRHFAFYLDGAGSFEVLSSDFEILPEESGSWESLKAVTAS